MLPYYLSLFVDIFNNTLHNKINNYSLAQIIDLFEFNNVAY